MSEIIHITVDLLLILIEMNNMRNVIYWRRWRKKHQIIPLQMTEKIDESGKKAAVVKCILADGSVPMPRNGE